MTKPLIFILCWLFLGLVVVKTQAQTFNPLPEYNEERQLRVVVSERPEIPDGLNGVLVYDTGGVVMIDLATKQQIMYWGLPLMYYPRLSIETAQIVFGQNSHVFSIDITNGVLLQKI